MGDCGSVGHLLLMQEARTLCTLIKWIPSCIIEIESTTTRRKSVREFGDCKMVNQEIPDDFDPVAYLEYNPDLVDAGVDPFRHFREFGRAENRIYKHLAGKCSSQDYLLHSNPETQRPKFIDHEHIWTWLSENFNREGLKVLEIGSRAVSSDSLWSKALPKVDYVGFDVLPGRNVDVVGDVHFLSEYFSENSFDLVISFAVFEHVALPWIAAEEITKVLKIGGFVALETHFSFSEHELPWHFFQFNSRALEVLFSNQFCYEKIDSGMSTPIVGRFSNQAAPYLRGKIVRDLYCHSYFAGRKVRNPFVEKDASAHWRDVASSISKNTSYPMESDLAPRE